MPLTKLVAAKTLTHHRCLTAVLTAAVGFGLGACGDEKKASTTKPSGTGSDTNGNTTDPGNDSNTVIPGGNGGGETDTPVTGTNLVLTIDDVVQPAAVYSFYGAPNANDSNAYLSVLPYDYFDWVQKHDYASVPKTAHGGGFRLNLTAMNVTANSTFPVTYAIQAGTSGDENTPFFAYDGACTATYRKATAGTITFESWTGTGTSTVITGRFSGVKLFDNQLGKANSAADGTFMTSTAVKPRASGAVIPAANADPDACNPLHGK